MSDTVEDAFARAVRYQWTSLEHLVKAGRAVCAALAAEREAAATREHELRQQLGMAERLVQTERDGREAARMAARYEALSKQFEAQKLAPVPGLMDSESREQALKAKLEDAETTLRIRLLEFTTKDVCHQCYGELTVTPENDVRCLECDGVVEALQAEVAELTRACVDWKRDIEQECAEVAALRSEVDRLKAQSKSRGEQQ